MTRCLLVALCLLFAGLPADAATRWWVGGGSTANWNATGNTNWGTASNTRDNASVPTSADDVCLDGSAFGNTPGTISAAITVKSIDMTGTSAICTGGGSSTAYGAGGAVTLTHNLSTPLTIGAAGQTGGNALWSSNANFTYTLGNAASSSLNFEADGGTNSFNPGGKTFGNVTIGNTNGGQTVQLAGNLTIGNVATLTLTRGTLDANGKDLSMGFFASSNSNTRVLTMSTGNWTLTGTAGTPWNTATVSGLTATCSSATITASAAATGTRSFFFPTTAVCTIGSFVVNNSSLNAQLIQISTNAPTIGTLTLTNVRNWLASANVTVSTAFSWTGPTQSNPGSIIANGTTPWTLTLPASAAVQTDNIYVGQVTRAGSGATFVVNPGYDSGLSSGFTITPPSAGGGGGGRIIGG